MKYLLLSFLFIPSTFACGSLFWAPILAKAVVADTCNSPQLKQIEKFIAKNKTNDNCENQIKKECEFGFIDEVCEVANSRDDSSLDREVFHILAPSQKQFLSSSSAVDYYNSLDYGSSKINEMVGSTSDNGKNKKRKGTYNDLLGSVNTLLALKANAVIKEHAASMGSGNVQENCSKLRTKLAERRIEVMKEKMKFLVLAKRTMKGKKQFGVISASDMDEAKSSLCGGSKGLACLPMSVNRLVPTPKATTTEAVEAPEEEELGTQNSSSSAAGG